MNKFKNTFSINAIRRLYSNLKSINKTPTYQELEKRVKELEGGNHDLSDFLNSINHPSYLIDKNLDYITCNQDVLSTLGLSSVEEIVGKNYADNHSEEERNELAAKVSDVFQTGEQISYRYTADGQYKVINPLKNEKGEIVAVNVQEIDIKKLLSNDLLPICANKKEIREEDGPNKGNWTQIESYINKRYGPRFSHGICPDCAKELYPDMDLS